MAGMWQTPVGCGANEGTDSRVPMVLPSGAGCIKNAFQLCRGHRVIY